MNDTNSNEQKRIDRADQLGLAFVRTLILLNGGAILAVLTFLGNASAQTAITVQISSIVFAIASFLVSIISCLFALGVSYTFYGVDVESAYSRFWDNWIVLFNAIAMIIALFGFSSGVVALLLGVVEPT